MALLQGARPVAQVVRKLILRACPRCHGDLMLDNYDTDEEFKCLQCGRHTNMMLIKQPAAA